MTDEEPPADWRPPPWDEINRAINAHVLAEGEWAGIPLPLRGLGLTVEPRHPRAAQIAQLQRIVDGDDADLSPHACTSDDLGWREVNRWWGRTRHGVWGWVAIYRHEDGRTSWGFEPGVMRRNRMLFGPFETLDAWHLDSEARALDQLAQLLPPRMFKAYVLSGSFLETSRRSGIHYLFRRCRPTVAWSHNGDPTSMRILACLCLHPIAYYQNTFCGAMVPTDDIVAHLLLMRGDEPLYWRRAEQHHPSHVESGLWI